LLYGLTLLQEAIKDGALKQRRPLGKVVTPEEIASFSSRCLRDEKQQNRIAMTQIDSPKGV